MPTLTIIRGDKEYTSQSPHLSVLTLHTEKAVVEFERQVAWPDALVGDSLQKIKGCELVFTDEDMNTYSGVICHVETSTLYFDPQT